jgi:P4 family phage/plasmid primase-like protien
MRPLFLLLFRCEGTLHARISWFCSRAKRLVPLRAAAGATQIETTAEETRRTATRRERKGWHMTTQIHARNGQATITPLDEALRLLKAGYWPIAIHPPGKNGKRPIGKDWGLTRWTAAKLRQTYAYNPRAGVGICFGPGRSPSGGWLIDIEGDGPEANQCRVSLLEGEVLDTIGWTSARGGHDIFEADGERLLEALASAGATESKELGKAGVWHLDTLPGLEFRVGGYKADGKTIKQVQSVVPPTIGTDGKPRQWDGSDTLASLPESAYVFLEGLAGNHEAPSNQESPRGAESGSREPRERYVTAALTDECKRIESAPEGTRNRILNNAAFKLGQLVGANAFDRRETERSLLDAARRSGLGDREALATIRSGLDAGVMQPRDLSGVGTGRNGPGPPPSVNGEPPPFPCTDTGNAERMVAWHGKSIRYCHPWTKWLHFDGRRWAPDDTAAIRRLAKKTARAILVEASKVNDKNRREGLIKWALATESAKLLNAMIGLASAEEGIPVLPKELNTNPWLLNVQNGTIDLRTGKIRAHRREDLITALAPVEYHQAAPCPLWDAGLDRFFAKNPELIAFWDRMCGIALTGDVSAQILPILYGLGDNGKSTMTGAMLGLLGPDYAVIAPPSLLLLRRGEHHPTELVYLFAKRLVVAMETEEGARLNEPLIKQLTGSDPITARGMRQDNWTFDPTHKLWLCTNHKPVIKGTDHAIWRRPKLVPFNVAIPEEEKISNFPNLLKAEYPGILARAVRGCLDWQKNGLGVPAAVKEATSKYRKEQDLLSDFIAEEMTVHKDLRAKAHATYQRYRRFTEHLGEEPISLTKFGLAIAERGFEKLQNNGTWYLGIGLRSEPAPDSNY